MADEEYGINKKREERELFLTGNKEQAKRKMKENYGLRGIRNRQEERRKGTMADEE